MISVLILTLNEEANIDACLDAVAWADDVLVLDSGSTDATVARAEARGARVMHRPFDTFAAQRNYGLRAGGLRHDWVLHLDADERVTPALRDELHAVAQSPAARDAYRVPAKLMFQGRWLKHAGMYPTYQVRFGRRAALSFTQVGHGQRGTLPPARVGTLREPLLHYAFSKGVADWFARHNRYSTDEARLALDRLRDDVNWRDLLAGDAQARRRALKDLSFRLPLRPLLRFLYVYVLRRGFLDGRPGFDYAVMLAVYEYMTGLKLRAARSGGGPDAGSPPMQWLGWVSTRLPENARCRAPTPGARRLPCPPPYASPVSHVHLSRVPERYVEGHTVRRRGPPPRALRGRRSGWRPVAATSEPCPPPPARFEMLHLTISLICAHAPVAVSSPKHALPATGLPSQSGRRYEISVAPCTWAGYTRSPLMGIRRSGHGRSIRVGLNAVVKRCRPCTTSSCRGASAKPRRHLTTTPLNRLFSRKVCRRPRYPSLYTLRRAHLLARTRPGGRSTAS